MQPRGPLQELPPEMFMSTSNVPGREFKTRPHKRPPSPGSSVLLSPTKRRILNEEGLYSVRSLKPARKVALPAPFAEMLARPGSPSKRLHFESSPSTTDQTTSIAPSTPRTTTTSSLAFDTTSSVSRPSPLAPSPEFKSRLRAFRPEQATSQRAFELPVPKPFPFVITSEPPPPPDPQSIHYPGFSVYQDTHTSPASPQLHDTDEASSLEQDEEKENTAPRRKARKPVIAPPPLDLKPIMPTTPDPKKRLVGKARLAPATPRQVTFSALLENATPRTPQRLDSDTIMSSLFVTPILTADQRKERRRMLEDEANVAESTDEESL